MSQSGFEPWQPEDMLYVDYLAIGVGPITGRITMNCVFSVNNIPNIRVTQLPFFVVKQYSLAFNTLHAVLTVTFTCSAMYSKHVPFRKHSM